MQILGIKISHTLFAIKKLIKVLISNMLVFLTGEHSDSKKVMISMHCFSSSRCMPSFILVRKLVLLVCIKSALIMSFPAPTINKTPLNFSISNGSVRFV